MIAEYRRKPWWRKIGRESEVRGMILAEWSAFSKWTDCRIAFMRQPNAEAHGRRSRTVQPIVGSSSEDTE